MTRRRILVPIDFSTHSDLALEYAKHIAAGLNAMISCIYVIEDQGILTDNMINRELRHKLRREAENKLSEKVNSILIKEEKAPFELIITSGKVHQKVLEKSRDLKAQLIVMGRSNSKNKKTKRLGSNTRQVIAHSLIPVISVHEQTTVRHKHIIVALDLTKPYAKQISWGIATATLLGASVSLLSVIEKEEIGHRPVYLKRLKESQQLFVDKDIRCTTHLLDNKTTIPREIISFSNRTDPGMILLMTHSESKVASSHLGMIANQIISNSNVPVQSINPEGSSGFSMGESLLIEKSTSSTWRPLEDQLIDNQHEI